jgi:FKBP-type peptidyl-prolyl cis-trans isomerase
MVIPGWDEGLSEMKVGEKARFRIPSALAYGENSHGPAIPPNSDLVFDVWVVGAKATPRGLPTGHP